MAEGDFVVDPRVWGEGRCSDCSRRQVEAADRGVVVAAVVQSIPIHHHVGPLDGVGGGVARGYGEILWSHPCNQSTEAGVLTNIVGECVTARQWCQPVPALLSGCGPWVSTPGSIGIRGTILGDRIRSGTFHVYKVTLRAVTWG